MDGLGCHEFQRIFMVLDGFSWILQDFVDFHRSSGISRDGVGFSWISADFGEFSWISGDFDGFV